MNIVWQAGWLIGQVEISDLGRNFRNGAGLSTGNLVFGAVVVVGVVVSLLLLTRWRKVREERGFNNPRSLFRELCQAHNIDRKDRLLLKSLARSHNLNQPSRVFLEPDRFDLGTLSESKTVEERLKLEQLRDRIFGKRLTRDAEQSDHRRRRSG